MVAGGEKNTVVPASAPSSLSQDGGHSYSATSLSLALAQKPGGLHSHPQGQAVGLQSSSDDSSSASFNHWMNLCSCWFLRNCRPLSVVSFWLYQLRIVSSARISNW